MKHVWMKDKNKWADSLNNVWYTVSLDIVYTVVRSWLYIALVAEKSPLHIGGQLIIATTATNRTHKRQETRVSEQHCPSSGQSPPFDSTRSTVRGAQDICSRSASVVCSRLTEHWCRVQRHPLPVHSTTPSPFSTSPKHLSIAQAPPVSSGSQMQFCSASHPLAS